MELFSVLAIPLVCKPSGLVNSPEWQHHHGIHISESFELVLNEMPQVTRYSLTTVP